MRVRRAYGAPAAATGVISRLQVQSRPACPEYERFVVLPSNLEGLEAALMLGSGVSPFVAIVGPTGWGKSHLMRVAAEQSLSSFGVRPKIRQGCQLTRGGRWDLTGPLILDDVHLCLGRPREFQALRNALELRVRLGRPTMVCFTGMTKHQIASMLPHMNCWTVAEVPLPHPEERQAILRMLVTQERLVLSDRLVRHLAKSIDGSGDALRGVVQRLGVSKADWTGAEDELLALGTVRPFLAQPHAPLRWVDCHVRRVIEPLGLEGYEDLATNLSIHILRKMMGIAESDVSQYYRIEPGDVFSIEHAFECALHDPKVQRLERVCLDALSDAFDLF